jgi:hypothetical protein
MLIRQHNHGHSPGNIRDGPIIVQVAAVNQQRFNWKINLKFQDRRGLPKLFRKHTEQIFSIVNFGRIRPGSKIIWSTNFDELSRS